MKGQFIDQALANKYMLVPESHDGEANWFKIVVMDHVTQGLIDRFLMDLDLTLEKV